MKCDSGVFKNQALHDAFRTYLTKEMKSSQNSCKNFNITYNDSLIFQVHVFQMLS
jgi:hypothetical protein